jgi:hypothetical protein
LIPGNPGNPPPSNAGRHAYQLAYVDRTAVPGHPAPHPTSLEEQGFELFSIVGPATAFDRMWVYYFRKPIRTQ